MDLQLAQRTFFVTGGSRGVGRAIVQCLLDEGARVATCARDADALRLAWKDVASEQRQRLVLETCDAQANDAAAVLSTLRPRAILSSDLKRAVQTAEYVARKSNASLMTSTALREEQLAPGKVLRSRKYRLDSLTRWRAGGREP